MGPSELIVSTAILDGGKSVGKSELVHQLLLQLAADGYIGLAHVPEFLAAVMRRESLASSGIGCGVAMPHTKHTAIDQPHLLLALCRTPVEFDSIDREPADIFALWLTPGHASAASLRHTTRWSQLLQRRLADEVFRKRLRASETAQDIAERLDAIDREGFQYGC